LLSMLRSCSHYAHSARGRLRPSDVCKSRRARPNFGTRQGLPRSTAESIRPSSGIVWRRGHRQGESGRQVQKAPGQHRCGVDQATEDRVGSHGDHQASRYCPEFSVPRARNRVVVRRQCDLITSCRNIPGAIVANRISIVSDRSAQWAAANVAGPTLLQLQSLKISPRRGWTK
jgi:hypothetical protein